MDRGAYGMSGFRSILAELRRRRVWSVAAGYAVAAWIVIEVADTVFPHLYLPAWTVTAVIVAALCGFPFAVVLAWYFDVVADPAGEAGSGRAGAIGLVLAGVSLVLAAGGAAFVSPRLAAFGQPDPASASAPWSEAAASLVVLPFSMLSPDADDEYFADGITEELIGVLGRLPELRVLGRTSSFAFKGHAAEARDVGDSLGVAAAVVGSVRRSGSRLRVSAQLVDTETGYQLWGHTYDRDVSDVLTVQEEIAHSIASALDLRIPRGLDTFRATRRGVDPEAYDLYLRGRHAWRRRTAEGLELALDLFQQALARDSLFAPAWAGLSDTYRTIAGYGYRAGRNEVELADSTISRALALAPGLAEAHAALGLHLALAQGERRRALVSLHRALELNPSYASAYHWQGLVLTELGRLDEALEQHRRARELDPLAPALHGAYARTLMLAGELERAEEMARRGIELAPDMIGPLMMLSKVHEMQGRAQEALAVAQRAAEVAPDNPNVLAQLARAHVASADTARALAILADLESRRHPCAGCVAEVYAALRDSDRLFSWLEATVWNNLGGFYMPATDPAYDAFRGDPRFTRFLREEGLEKPE